MEQAGIVDREADVCAAQVREPAHRVGGRIGHPLTAVQAVLHGVGQRLKRPVLDRPQQFAVPHVVPVGRSGRNADLAGGFPEHDRLRAAAAGQVGRRVGERVGQVTVVIGGPADARLCHGFIVQQYEGVDNVNVR